MADKQKLIASLSRAVTYDDGSKRLEVDYDSGRKFDDGTRYFRIDGIGDTTFVYVKDIPFLIEALQLVAELDAQVAA